MHNKTVLTLVLSAVLSTSLHAQVSIAAYPEKACICKQSNGKFSLIDFHNKPIITNLDTIFNTSYDCYIMSKGGLKGLYNEECNRYIPFEFSDISFYNNAYWLVTKNGKQGLYSRMTQEILPPIYDSIKVANSNSIAASKYFIVKKGLYGVCNNKGKFIVEPQYTHIEYTPEDYFKLTKDNSYDYIFNFKDVVKDITVSESQPIIILKDWTITRYYNYQKNGLWGILHNNGQPIITAQYDKPLRNLGNIKSDSIIFLKACKNNLYGVVDMNNKTMLPFQYKNIEPTFLVNTIELTTDEGKQLYDMVQKRLALEFFYDQGNVTDRYLYLKKDGMETAVDYHHMQILFPFKYNSILGLNDNEHFMVTIEGKTAVVNRKDKQIIPYGYDEIKVTSKPNLFIIRKEKQYGIVNLKNELVYGMTPYHIEAYDDCIELTNITTWETIKKLDYNLKEIK